jgi:hypothetical protein
MIVKGSFELTMHPEPPYDTVEGVTLARIRFEKRFAGPLEGTSEVNMIGARTTIEGSAGYVAIERVTGALVGKRGSFVLMHTGLMTRGTPSLSVVIVPDSGTGELTGIFGTMKIVNEGGKHGYELDYELVRAHPDAGD